MKAAALFTLALVLVLACLLFAAAIPQTAGSGAQIAQAQATSELGRALQLQALGNLVGLCLVGLLGVAGLAGGLGLAAWAISKSAPESRGPALIRGAGAWSGRSLPGDRQPLTLPDRAQPGELVTFEAGDSDLVAILTRWEGWK